MPASAQAEVKAEFWKLFDNIEAPAGDRAMAVARARIDAFATRYRGPFPSAASAC